MGTLAAVLAAVALTPLGSPAAAAEPQWTPHLWVDEDVVELRTTRPGEPPHWFKVWVAVVDDQLYVRLGRRASERIEQNTTAPEVAVRIAGQEFERVRVENAPEMAERVADEMAEKYWTDVFVRWLPHPLTLRLVPAR
ncbi:MAG TPA: hypothetical protein VNO26_08980 [Candidatus Limnocylindria bacterium]|nr:hypothetical protein [Candidatus Limnocylindria bacterium]